jgi:transcriptional regulator with XRE-family HTH domain
MMTPGAPACQKQEFVSSSDGQRDEEGFRVRVEEIVGQRIRERREQLELSQAQLGKLIGEHLGRDWPRQAVSAAERGQRAFTVAEMVTLAYVLGVSIGQLLTPPVGTEKIEVAPGVQAERDVLMMALVPAMAADKPQEQLQEVFTRLLRHVRQLSSAADGVQKDMDVMQRLAVTMAQQERDGLQQSTEEQAE